MTKQERSQKLGQSILDCKEARRALEGKLRHMREVGRNLTTLGEWLTHYTHGQIAKEPLRPQLNVTKDVTICLTLSYLPVQELIELVNTADALNTQVKELEQESERLAE